MEAGDPVLLQFFYLVLSSSCLHEDRQTPGVLSSQHIRFGISYKDALSKVNL